VLDLAVSATAFATFIFASVRGVGDVTKRVAPRVCCPSTPCSDDEDYRPLKSAATRPPGARKVVYGMLIVVGIAVSWVGSTQASKFA
jgi:hypothetical protein